VIITTLLLVPHTWAQLEPGCVDLLWIITALLLESLVPNHPLLVDTGLMNPRSALLDATMAGKATTTATMRA